MPDPIRVTDDVAVPAHALSVRAVRASGPGGQNVNKVASKIELRVDLDLVVGLDSEARARLAALTAHRRDADGRLRVTSQRFRDQGRNLEDARAKVRALLARALEVPRKRVPTRATAAAGQRRLEEKRRAAVRKRHRARVKSEDD